MTKNAYHWDSFTMLGFQLFMCLQDVAVVVKASYADKKLILKATAERYVIKQIGSTQSHEISVLYP